MVFIILGFEENVFLKHFNGWSVIILNMFLIPQI